MIKEFRDFIMRGNVLDLAVAVIIAGAFGKIVGSFTEDILMPPIGMILGNMDFTDLKIVLQAASGDLPEVAIRWGQLVTYIIDFIIIAFVLFMIIKAYNRLNAKPEPAPAPPAGPTEKDLLTEIRDLLKKG
mgnify:CR=1 FL=1